MKLKFLCFRLKAFGGIIDAQTIIFYSVAIHNLHRDEQVQLFIY